MTRLTALLLSIALALPAAAQTLPDLDRRVTKVERQVDRISRRVLPKNEQTVVEPEVSTAETAKPATPPPAPASAASVNDLTERVGAVERREREITSQIEEQGNRLRLAEERLAKLQADAELRLAKLEGTGTPTVAVPPSAAPSASAPAPAVAPPPTPAASAKPAAVAPTKPTSVPDAPEPRFKAAIALYQSKKWSDAETAFQGYLEKYPSDKRISEVHYWLGRSYYNDGAFDRSAREQFDNYKANPKGDHAQESLFWVGRSLVRLDRAKEACQVYDLAAKVYAGEMKPEMRPQFATARKTAGCR